MSAPALPWDRQPNEPPRAFLLFARYVQMEPALRALATIANELKLSRERVRQFAVRWHWAERAAAFDSEVCRLALSRSELARLRMHDEHAEFGRVSVAKARDTVLALDPRKVAPHDAVELARAGTEIERRARGIDDRPGANQTAVQTNVAVVWGAGKPAWLEANPVPASETGSKGERKANGTQVLVPIGEKVLVGDGAGISPAPSEDSNER